MLRHHTCRRSSIDLGDHHELMRKEPPLAMRVIRGVWASGRRGNNRCAPQSLKRIKISPQTTSTAAAMRTARNGSFKTITAMTAAKRTLVSRRQATTAIGKRVIAHSAMP